MMTTTTTRAYAALSRAEWSDLDERHRHRADILTAGWRQRQQTGEKHSIEDFLFTYYPFKPSLLRRWHPGAGVSLEDASHETRASWRWYQTRGAELVADAAGFIESKPASINFIERLMRDTAARPGQFSCFGLHEWAMVYQLAPHEVRHQDTPLRLSQAETDAVVESHKIACSHYDAYRFFTPAAAPLNALRPTRDNQPMLEQPGCLHAGMDVYKWITKLGPLIPGELLLDSFELSRDIRILDMQASPYDVSEHDLSAVAIETDEGKAEYVRRQREFAARSNSLRARVVEAIETARKIARLQP